MHTLADVARRLRGFDPADGPDFHPVIAPEPTPEAPPARAFGGTVHRPALRQRLGVGYVTVRQWAAASKGEDLAAFKDAKRTMDAGLIAQAAEEIADAVPRFFAGPALFGWVTNVACGHSCREDCFGKRVAQAVAQRLGLPWHQAFRDRFIKRVSHPREFDKLPPLEVAQGVHGAALVVDDLATSGWHIAEALSELRARGVLAVGAVWIYGQKGLVR